MRKYFITGLLILVPLAITLWVLHAVISTMDQSLLLLPPEWRPENLVGFQFLGLGTILTLLIIFVTGLLAQNFYWQLCCKNLGSLAQSDSYREFDLFQC